MSILEEVEKHRSDIETDSYTATWKEVLGQYKDGDLLIQPDYQRLFRWDLDQQTQYIESLLLGIPTPPIFVAENEDGRFEVLDGLQRISTILKFFANERDPIPHTGLDQDELDTDVEDNDISKPTRLLQGRILPSLEGGTALNLPETLVRVIKYSRLNVILIERGSKRKARYEVFRRLNRFGSILSDQEIRNCTARLLGTKFPDDLRSLAREPIVRSVLALSDEARRKMGVEEALLRLLSFNFSKEPLRHEVREYLDEFMEFASDGHFAITSEINHKIMRTFQMIHDAASDGTAFRLKNQGFSSNMFDIVATGVFHNLETLTPAIIADRRGQLVNSAEFKSLIGAGSNTRAKLEGRLQLGKRWFARS